MLSIQRKISAYNHYNYNKPTYIIIHYVGAQSSTAYNNAVYFAGGDRGASAHYFVDDTSIWQSVEDNHGAWHVGNTKTAPNNQNSIGIEMCCMGANLQVTAKTEENTVELTKYLMKKYNIPVANVRTHAEVTNYGKTCPNWSANNWDRWKKFKAKLTTASTPSPNTDAKQLYRIRKTWADAKSQVGAYSSLESAKQQCPIGYSVFDDNGKCVYTKGTTTTTSALYRVKTSDGVQLGAFSNLDNAKKLAQEKQAIVYDENGKVVVSYVSTTDEVSRYAETGTFYPNTTIYFRNAPDLNSPIQGTYGSGESVKYDLVVLGKSYNWISWISASTGVRRYMPIRDKATGEKWGYAV